MSYNDLYDRALRYIERNETFSKTKDHISDFTSEENDLLVEVFNQLNDDGYVRKLPTKYSSFVITMKGREALKKSLSPYSRKSRLTKIKNIADSLNSFRKFLVASVIFFVTVIPVYILYKEEINSFLKYLSPF